ncbi:MAG: M48 family metalloprotease, partial [Woeseia sp.]|nr:M48 family metalloprotease [Woeseia sp.]
MKLTARILLLATLLVFASGCAVNPVTGKREITLVGEASEISMGQQNYAPMRQSQGGEYDIDPELTAYVSSVGQRLAAVSDRPLPYEFVVLNNSVPNAWALPGGKIAINRGLLTELDSEAELAAVLGHEIVHAAARHTARRMEQGMLLQGLVLATAVATSDSDYGNFAVGGANLAAQLVSQKYGRSAELESDYYGMRYMARAGYNPEGAVSLQKTFVRLNDGRQTDWLTGLFASHPPSEERVATNIKTAAELGATGEFGDDRYRKVMAKTMAAIPAYKVYDEGREALGKNNPQEALAKAEQAIGMLPAEAHFYALRGDARLLQKDYQSAIQNYDIALRRRSDFFYYYLQRGRAYNETGNIGAAEADLEKSLTLLPTGPAHLMLGDIAARRGNNAKALEHYKVVAQGEGEVAQRAQTSMTRLDIGQNPGNYIQNRCDPDGSGNLVVSVRNATQLAVRGVVVAVQYNDNAGRVRQVQKAINQTLSPGEIASVNTGLAPYAAGSGCPVAVV